MLETVTENWILVKLCTRFCWNFLDSRDFSWKRVGMSLGSRPGPAWPGPGLLEGHFWDLAHRGPGPFILAQVWPGPEKYGPNSTHRDEFGLHSSLARPSPAWPGPYRRSFLRLACHGLGRSILAQVWPGPEKNGPNSSLLLYDFWQILGVPGASTHFSEGVKAPECLSSL